MSEEKKVNETTTEEEVKKTEGKTIDADVKTEADGTQKAVEHVGIGQKVWNGLCFVGRGIKKGLPYVGAAALGAAAAYGHTYILGKKADDEDRIAGETQQQIPENTGDNQ